MVAPERQGAEVNAFVKKVCGLGGDPAKHALVEAHVRHSGERRKAHELWEIPKTG